MLCSAEQISATGHPPKLEVFRDGRQDTFNSTFSGYAGCRGCFRGRLSWAVADGTEQEGEPVLCICVFVGKVVFVLGVSPFFHPSQYLLTRCLHRAPLSPQSETKYLNVVCSQQPSMDAKWVDGAKPLFKIRIHLDSTIYTQVSQAP